MSTFFTRTGSTVVAIVVLSGLFASSADAPAKTERAQPAPEVAPELEVATFGSGCFWCSEAVFEQLRGVESVVSGYSGGTLKNPTYKQVRLGKTGHAEVVQVKFDPTVITYAELLEVFWLSHDPTTKNRQGYDSGTQYRSAIFYHSGAQRDLAEEYRDNIDDAHIYLRRVVTEITEFSTFYPAEDYHQDYFANNPTKNYCRATIGPKVDKLRKVFAKKLK